MVSLPGGFSPMNAVRQIASEANYQFNPWDTGRGNYDVFGNLGKQRSGGGGGAPSSGGPTTITLNEAQPLSPINTGGGGGSGTNQANIDYVNRAFDTRIAGLQGQLATLDPAQQAAQLNILNQYQNKANDLQTGLAQGQRNLATSRNQVQDSRVRGLQSLSDQARQMSQSYSNQLGAYGAGDSSAAQLINQAIAGQTSRNRGEVLRGTSDQFNEIATQEQDLMTSFEQNKRDLDGWKQSSLADLSVKFLQQKQAIEAEMQNADLQRQQQLAQYDAALTQSAMDRLSQIEQSYKDSSAQLISTYQNMFAPQDIQIAPELQQYQVKAVDPGKLAGLAMPTAVNPENEAQVALRKRLEEQSNPSAILGF